MNDRRVESSCCGVVKIIRAMGNNTSTTIVSEANDNASKDGRYSYTKELGRGGFGCVLKAVDTQQQRDVAVKLIKATKSFTQYFLNQMPDETKRGREEGVLLSSLKHDNIVAIRDYFECSKRRDVTIAIVMEYCPTDLSGYLQKRFKNFTRRLPEDKSLQWCTQLALALEYIHDRGYVHRDLKPSNILVTSTNNLKVADVGLAKIFHKELHGDTSFKQYMQTVAGTRPYMAPEIWEEHYDESADIFSMGLVMFTLCEVPTKLMPLVQGEHFLGQYFVFYPSSQKREAMSLLQPKKCLQYEKKLFNDMLQYNKKQRPTAHDVVQKLKYMRMNKMSIQLQGGQRIQQAQPIYNWCESLCICCMCFFCAMILLYVIIIFSFKW